MSQFKYSIVTLDPSDLEGSMDDPKLTALRAQGYRLVWVFQVQDGKAVKLAGLFEPPSSPPPDHIRPPSASTVRPTEMRTIEQPTVSRTDAIMVMLILTVVAACALLVQAMNIGP